jgi:hypothetical protein
MHGPSYKILLKLFLGTFELGLVILAEGCILGAYYEIWE